MKLRVDPEKCYGHALCLEDAPELFGWDEEHKKAFATGDVPPALEAQARQAARCCPEQAIVVIA